MPSASDRKFKTKTVWNSTAPFWDETFQFKVYSSIKNILHLSLFDENVITRDEQLCALFFDVGELPLGDTIAKRFALIPKGTGELEVELTMTKLCDTVAEKITTNGVVVCRELSCLEVKIDKSKVAKVFKDKVELVLTVNGAYETARTRLSHGSAPVDIFPFHVVKNQDLEITAQVDGAHVPNVSINRDEADSRTHDNLLILPLKSLPVDKEVDIAFPVAVAEKLDLEVKVKDCPDQLDVRLGFDLCQEEKDFLQRRKTVVASAVRAALGLRRDLQDHEVPVIAVSATGGGARAMTSLYGMLSGLKKMNLLDAVSYITGASGSTWCMSKLYEDADWSRKDLAEPINNVRKHMAMRKSGAFSFDRLKYYHRELDERSREGHHVSFTNLWGLILESMFHDGEHDARLSDQQEALTQGQNPLPLYLAMNVKTSEASTLEFKEWCEFSPYEVGLIKYGAFIRPELFDSEFFMGRVMKKNKESRICYLLAVWSNVFSVNVLDAWHAEVSSEDFWQRWTKEPPHSVMDEEKWWQKKRSDLSTRVLASSGILPETLKNVLTSRPLDAEHHNFLRGFQIHENYQDNKTFHTWEDTELKLYPHELTPSADALCLVDSGYYINASFPPLLRDERKVDIILSFDYTLGEYFKAVERTYEYCTKLGIAFPKIAVMDEDKKNPKECYVFTNTDDPDAPIVLHFPLVSDTFKKYKAPGVERQPAEMGDGHMDLSSTQSPYSSLNFQYKEHDFNQLLNLTEYNVMNSTDAILQALRSVVERKTSSADLMFESF